MTKFILAVGLVLAGWVAGSSPTRAAEDKPLAFTYVAADGTNVDLATMRGQVVLIFFWATWSKPSRDDVPIVVRVRKKYKDKGFAVLGVSLDSDLKTMSLTRTAIT